MLIVGCKLRAFVVKSSDGNDLIRSIGVKHFTLALSLTLGAAVPSSLYAADVFEDKLLTTPASQKSIAKGPAAHCYADMASSKCCVLPLVAVHRIGK